MTKHFFVIQLEYFMHMYIGYNLKKNTVIGWVS